MDTALLLIGVAAIHLIAVASPGPSFVLIARASVAQGRGSALWMALGLGIGTVIWAVAAWFGLSLLFLVAPWLYLAMKIGGGLFLVWIAVQMWRHANQPVALSEGQQGSLAALPSLRRGLGVQLANPKVAIFFGSIFVGLVPTDADPNLLALVFLVVFLDEFCWYALVASLFSVDRVRNHYKRLKSGIDRVCGGFLGLLGLKLATS